MNYRRLVNNCFLGVLLLSMLLLPACASPRTPTAVATATAIHTPTIAVEEVRPPLVAGAFYPAEPEQLQNWVDDFLQQAQQVPQEPIALIAPHAGYVYSGAVAAAAFK